MGKYTGSQCMICQNAFKEEDDIVVCPDCGTPYHRSCYSSKGHCINDALHQSGMGWQEMQYKHREKIGGRECSRCHHVNLPDARECAVCHQPLGAQANPYDENTAGSGQPFMFNPADPCCGLSPDEEFEGEKLGHIAAFVGNNTLYYIPIFKRFKETGKKISLNLSCLLFPHLYFAYRRMWIPALLVMLASALLGIPAMLSSLLNALSEKEFIESMTELYSQYNMDGAELFEGMKALLKPYKDVIFYLDMLFYGLMLTGRTVLSIFANWIYYRHTLKKVSRVRKNVQSPQMAAMMLKQDGGTRGWNILWALGLNYAFTLGVVFVIAIGVVLLA